MRRTPSVVSFITLLVGVPTVGLGSLLVEPGYGWTTGDYIMARGVETPSSNSSQRYTEVSHSWASSSNASFTVSNGGKGNAKFTNTMAFLWNAGQEADYISIAGSASGWSHSDAADFHAQTTAHSAAQVQFHISQPLHVHAFGSLQVSGVNDVGPGNVQSLSVARLTKISGGSGTILSLALNRAVNDVASIDLYTILPAGSYQLDGLTDIGTDSTTAGGDFAVTSTYGITLEFSQIPGPSALTLAGFSMYMCGRRRR